MSPGEIEGYLRQTLRRNVLTEVEKEAIKLASDAVKILVEMDKFFIKSKEPNTGF